MNLDQTFLMLLISWIKEKTKLEHTLNMVLYNQTIMQEDIIKMDMVDITKTHIIIIIVHFGRIYNLRSSIKLELSI